MLVVTEPTRTSIKTAGLVKRLSAELGIKNVKILGNKVRKEEELKYLQDNFLSLVKLLVFCLLKKKYGKGQWWIRLTIWWKKAC